MIIEPTKKKKKPQILTHKADKPTIPEILQPSISNIYEDQLFPGVTDTIPTDDPVRPFEKIRIYKNGATQRLYIYDSVDRVWNFTTLT